MNIKIRRVIMSFFFLAFFTIGPLLILYASGYRYDFKRGVILRTGNIFIEAPDIRDGLVSLNNELHDESLSRRMFIQNLLPGEYAVSITKEERYEWRRTVRVNPGLTTFIQDAVLFLKADPRPLLETTVEEFTLAPNGRHLIYRRRHEGFSELFLYDINNGNETLLYRADEDSELRVEWAPSSNKIMIATDELVTVIQNRSPYSQTSYESHPSINTSWDIRSDTFLYQVSPTTVERINTATQQKDLIYTSQSGLLGSLFAVFNSIYLLEETENGINVILYNSDVKESITIATLPRNSSYKFVDFSDSHLIVSNEQMQKVHLIKKPFELSLDFTQSVLQFDAQNAYFSPNQNRILLHNDFELSSYDLHNNRQRLINRFSKPIDEVQWYSDSAHILINLGDEIRISDLNVTTGQAQLLTLQVAQEITDIGLLNENILLFAGILDDGGENGTLYSLPIK